MGSHEDQALICYTACPADTKGAPKVNLYLRTHILSYCPTLCKGTEKEGRKREQGTDRGRLQMVRLGQIIVVCFLRPTDTRGWGVEKRRKWRRKEGEEQVLVASDAAENRLQQGEEEKTNQLKIPPLPLVLTLHLSVPPISTHTPFVLSAYINMTSTRASWTRRGSSGVGGEWGVRSQHCVQSSMRRAGGLSLRVCVCVCNPWLNLTYYFKNLLPLSSLRCSLYSSLRRETLLCVTLLGISAVPSLTHRYIQAHFRWTAEICFYL